MKLKAIVLALFVAGACTSYALAGDGHGKGKGDTTTASSTGSTTTTTAKHQRNAKVTLCHKAGKSGRWVKITVAASAAKAHTKHGDQAPDADGKCPAPTAPPETTTTTTTTTTTP